jgi:farnesyl diphosphate synthase
VPETSTPDLTLFLAQARADVGTVLMRWGERVRHEMPGSVGEAIAYSLAGRGKRLRPALVMAAFRDLGGEGDVAELAAATEVVHTYSLVHDDLPCMDDDELRRGRPTTHVAYDVASATEAGYRMVPLAARVLESGSERLGLSPAIVSRIGSTLFDAAGARGMVGGQFLDLMAEGHTISIDELREIHRRKTGALITASTVIGALAADASDSQVAAIRAYGNEIGMAFQIADDVLDATRSSHELGKTAGKDLRQQKATFATVWEPEAALREARHRAELAVDQLGRGEIDSLLLREIAYFVVDRHF